MPKLKTHKGAAKRFKKTGTGKVKRGHANLRHILTSKDTKRKRKLRHGGAGQRRRYRQSTADDSVSVEALSDLVIRASKAIAIFGLIALIH